jgi:chorismate mutase
MPCLIGMERRTPLGFCNCKAAGTIVNRNGNVFGTIMSQIKESNQKLADIRPAGAMAELQDIRDSIDNIDASIIHMLAERFRCTQKVGVLKAQHNLPPSDRDREAQQKSPVSAILLLLLNLIQSLPRNFLPLSFVKSFGIMKPPGANV